MRTALRVLKEITTGHGYVIREEYWPNPGFEVEVMSDPNGDATDFADALTDAQPASEELFRKTAYTVDGYWIGDLATAKALCEDRGIAPCPWDDVERGELRPCAIGWCEAEQKWYGWSHRALYGFGIGDVVEEGDCTASSGWTDEYLAEHPEADTRLPIGFKAETLDDARKMAEAFAHSVS